MSAFDAINAAIGRIRSNGIPADRPARPADVLPGLRSLPQLPGGGLTLDAARAAFPSLPR
jgi:hypothetical protein